MNPSVPANGTGTTEVVIVGGGGFARETLDVIHAHNQVNSSSHITVIGIVDRDLDGSARELLERRGIRYLGNDEQWLRDGNPEIPYLVAVGDPRARSSIDSRYLAGGLRTHRAIVHPLAGIGSAAELGLGTIVCAGAQLSTNVRTGRHVHINPNATLGHDASVGDYVSINPAAVISGHVVLGKGSLVGASAVILERLHVGEWSTVGAAACVVRDVELGATVKGVPAR